MNSKRKKTRSARLQVYRLTSLFLVLATAVQTAQASNLCADVFRTTANSNSELLADHGSHPSLAINPTLATASENLLKFEKSVATQILEREYVLEPFLVSLIAKEHMLLIGPPGNAKTTLSKLLMNNVVDARTQKPSFYSMQMNKEITLSDTHGSINFKALSDEGVVKRNYNEGLLGAKLGFIDEAFDIRPGAFRNILDVLAERSHSQGTSHFKGETEVIIAATNKTLPEVYEEFNNSEQPRALIDRFAFVFFVPKEMSSIKSDRMIFSGDRSTMAPVSKLTFQDLDVMRSLTNNVEIPDYIADLAGLIHYRLTPEFESREVKSLEQYREKIQNGEHALPPFRSAKYLSPRTLAKAGNILKAIVVLDYIRKSGQRSLTASIDDLSKLRLFYQLNGPETKFLDAQLTRSLKEYEKDQIKAVQTERDIVNPLFDSVIKDFKAALGTLDAHHLHQLASTFKTLPIVERRQLADLLKDTYINGLRSAEEQSKDDVTIEAIASLASVDLMREMATVIWNEKAPDVIKSWDKQAALAEPVISKRMLRKLAVREQAGKETPRVARAARTPRRAGPLKKLELVDTNQHWAVPNVNSNVLTLSNDGTKALVQANKQVLSHDFQTAIYSNTWAAQFTGVAPLGTDAFLVDFSQSSYKIELYYVEGTSYGRLPNLTYPLLTLIPERSGSVLVLSTNEVLRAVSTKELKPLFSVGLELLGGALNPLNPDEIVYLGQTDGNAIKIERRSLSRLGDPPVTISSEELTSAVRSFAAGFTFGGSRMFLADATRGLIRLTTGKVLFFDLGTGTPSRVSESPVNYDSLDVSPDGRIVAIASPNSIALMDAVSWIESHLDGKGGDHRLGSLQTTSPVTTLRFSPDGTKLLTATATEVRAYEIHEGAK